MSANVAGNFVCAVLTALCDDAGLAFRLPSAWIGLDFFGPGIGGKFIPLAIAASTAGWFAVLLAETGEAVSRMWPTALTAQLFKLH